MILKNFRVFSQNVWKNKLLTNTVLEINKDFNIILIQEPPWSTIWSIPSSMSKEDKTIIRAPNYPDWVIFARNPLNDNDYPHVILYINTHLTSLCFSLQKDIFNHRDISCFSFFNKEEVFFLLNIYSNSNQFALKYLKNTEANIWNVLIMTGNFNIRDRDWDLDYLFHSVHSELLFDISDTLDLSFSYPTNPVPTRYSDNSDKLNSVINLIFLRPNSSELDNYSIFPNSWHLSDHALL